MSQEDKTLMNHPEMIKYRDFLIEAERKAQDDYDKTVLTLSSSTLGVSLAFGKDILNGVNPVNPFLLPVAWGCWVTSASFVLFSYWTSRRSLKHAIKTLDKGNYVAEPGGFSRQITEGLNLLSGALFILGVVVAAIFVYQNPR